MRIALYSRTGQPMSTTGRPAKTKNFFYRTFSSRCFYFTFRCSSKNCIRKPEEELYKKSSNLKNLKTSGTSREEVEKAENEQKPFKFLTWLDHFVLPRKSKSQFDQNYKEEHSQPVGDQIYKNMNHANGQMPSI